MPDTPHPTPVLSTTSTPQDIAAAVEAILMSLDRPLSAAALADGLFAPPAPHHADKENGDSAQDAAPRAPKGAEALVKKAIEDLNGAYAQSGRSFRIEPVAGGYRVMTLPEHAPAVAAFHRSRQNAKLSKAAVETLAIVAYKQPITRATLEAIRGVACGEVLRTLVDRRMVTIKGRAEELGRPLLYGTSKQFLDAFGLSSLNDLPSTAELKPFAWEGTPAIVSAPPSPATQPGTEKASAQPA